MDVTVGMWLDDIRDGMLFKSELYADGFPAWWLDKVLAGVQQATAREYFDRYRLPAEPPP